MGGSNSNPMATGTANSMTAAPAQATSTPTGTSNDLRWTLPKGTPSPVGGPILSKGGPIMWGGQPPTYGGGPVGGGFPKQNGNPIMWNGSPNQPLPVQPINQPGVVIKSGSMWGS